MEATRLRLNQKYVGRDFILTSDRKTHFMNSCMTIRMWHDCLTHAFRNRRNALANRCLGLHIPIQALFMLHAMRSRALKDRAMLNIAISRT